ncbi:MAG: class I SAM-dependent methyltransferase [Acidimicrobiales bacterium]
MLTIDFRRLGLEAGERVLDLGCGAGRHAFECLRRGALVAALDSDAVEVKAVAAMLEAMAGEAGTVGTGAAIAVRGDAFALPFPDGALDRVIAAEVLEHLPDDTAAMAELARVLRPGGRLAVTVPRFWPELVSWALSREYHTVDGGHVRIYRRSQLAVRLRTAGLEVVGSHHAHGLHSAYWWLKCLVGVGNEQNRAVRAYHRLLVWDIVRRPVVTRLAEAVLNPLCGKSLVLYLERATERPGGTR